MSGWASNTSGAPGSTHAERRWLPVGPCPNGNPLGHVAPMLISSTARLASLETPGNISDAEPCPACRAVLGGGGDE